jgi:hypothetical protein
LPALPDMPPFTGCQAALRSRLRHFPAAYEFFIQRTLREFGAVAGCVASFAAGSRTPENAHRALQSDLTCPRSRPLLEEPFIQATLLVYRPVEAASRSGSRSSQALT